MGMKTRTISSQNVILHWRNQASSQIGLGRYLRGETPGWLQSANAVHAL
jgi:hypothetical protein